MACKRLYSAREKQIGRKGNVPRPARFACCLGSHFGQKSRTRDRTAKRACFRCHLLKQLSLKDTGHQTEDPHAGRVTLWLPNCWSHYPIFHLQIHLCNWHFKCSFVFLHLLLLIFILIWDYIVSDIKHGTVIGCDLCNQPVHEISFLLEIPLPYWI